MAELIGPVIERVVWVLGQRTPGLLAAQVPFAEYRKLWTGHAANLPACWVMPVRTVFAEEGSTLRQAHQVTVKIGVQTSDPEELAELVVAYMRAVHRALEQSWPGDWVDAVSGGVVQNLFVREHDYGVVFQGGNMFARFPELDLVVEVEELREGL
jgi:hypothetical protein